MNLSKSLKGLLLFIFILNLTQTLTDQCENRQVATLIDISTSAIIKASVYEYKIQTFDNQANITNNQNGQLTMQGNLSRITLAHKGLRKEYIYNAKEIMLRLPSTHYYSRNKSAQAELQIIYHLEGEHKQNRHKVITMTQLYLGSKFLSKVQINICSEIAQLKKNNKFSLSKLIKIISHTPVLMYQGFKDFYPCRNDLLCMVRKQLALISQSDLNCLRQNIKKRQQNSEQTPRKTYVQKKLMQIQEIKDKSVNDQL